jgi:hypothetical protein
MTLSCFSGRSFATDPSEWIPAGYGRCSFWIISIPYATCPGFYEPIRKAANRLVGFGATEQNPVTSVFAGAASGVVGGCLFDALDRTPQLISVL